ncbi:MAG: ABC transporter ATP-binding protein [Parachlamydiales bacterium]|nr:ABC transporter ATP-binding protein [Parachlamydiales bacterium]
MKPLLEAKDIHKSFITPKSHNGTFQLLKGVNLVLEKGQTIAIMGLSGEGKSTLLHILGTLEKPSHGSLRIQGYDALVAKNCDRLRQKSIGFVFQSFYLLDEESVLDNILIPAKIINTSIKSSKKRALNLLEQVNMLNTQDRPAKYLSGGEKQRVAIARAMMNKPSILFADEPTGNLDNQTSKTISKLLFESCHQNNSSLILVTHDEHLAQQCDIIYRLKDGKLHLCEKQ